MKTTARNNAKSKPRRYGRRAARHVHVPTAPIDGARMRLRRKTLGLTQKDVSLFLRLNINTIARQERGETVPDHPDWVAHRFDELEARKRDGEDLDIASIVATNAQRNPIDRVALRQRRDALGLSPTELAELIPCALSTLMRWEAGSIAILHQEWLDWRLSQIEESKPVLTIRNLPDDVRDRLRVRAAKRGRSMESEARAILTAACAEMPERSVASLQEWVDQLYGKRKPKRVVEDFIAERRRESRRESRRK